jgi:geranylgeranyl diphosphate synthase type II
MDEHFNKLVKWVDSSLIAGIDPESGTLAKAMHYSLSLKGKRLRPLLFLTYLEAYQHQCIKYLDIACAIEYIHTYSLIHDDLPAMDDDVLRRGMPTVHVQFNEAIAILTGDTLLTLAFEKISSVPIPAAKSIKIINTLTRCIGPDGMAGGQVHDLEFQGNKEDIFNIHQMKTAELIKGTLLSAAEIVGLEQPELVTLEEAATAIGIAFQMADDLLDIEGNEEMVGKTLSKDQNNQSPNAVLFFGKAYVIREIDRLYEKTLTLLKKLKITYPPFLSLMKKMVYRDK